MGGGLPAARTRSRGDGGTRWVACAAAAVAVHLGVLWVLSGPRTEPAAAVPPLVALQVALEAAPTPAPSPAPVAEPPAPPVPPPADALPAAPAVAAPAPALPPIASQPRPVRVAHRPRSLPRTARPPVSASGGLDQPAAAAAQAPPAPPSPAAAQGDPNAVPAWQGRLARQLQQAQHYPDSAREAGREGVAAVSFTLDRAGQVLSVRLARSSGSAALDEEALALVHRAEPLGAPPPELPGRTVTLTVPIRFTLR